MNLLTLTITGLFIGITGMASYDAVQSINDEVSDNMQKAQELHQDYLERMEAKGLYPGITLEEYNNLNK